MTEPGVRPASRHDGGHERAGAVRARFLVTPVRRSGDPLGLGVPRPRLSAENPQLLWRLLSGNNRQLGRSPGAFDSCAEAEAAARALVQALDSVEVGVMCLTRPVRWVWSALVGGHVVAVSGRAYERERLAAGALDTFLEGLRDAAHVDATVLARRRS